MRISEGAYRNIQQALSTSIPRLGGAAIKEMIKQDVLEILRQEYGSSFSPQKIDLPLIQLSGRLPESATISSARIWSTCPIGATEEIIPQKDLPLDQSLKVFGVLSNGFLLYLNLYVVDAVKPFLFESKTSISTHFQEVHHNNNYSCEDETQQIPACEGETEQIQDYHMLSTKYFDWMLFSNPQDTAAAMETLALSQHEMAIQRLPRNMLFAPLDYLPLLSGTPLLDQLKSTFKRNRILDLIRASEYDLIGCNFTADQIEEIKRSLALLNLRLGMSSGF